MNLMNKASSRQVQSGNVVLEAILASKPVGILLTENGLEQRFTFNKTNNYFDIVIKHPVAAAQIWGSETQEIGLLYFAQTLWNH
jgi:hypothetical protein